MVLHTGGICIYIVYEPCLVRAHTELIINMKKKKKHTLFIVVYFTFHSNSNRKVYLA